MTQVHDDPPVATTAADAPGTAAGARSPLARVAAKLGGAAVEQGTISVLNLSAGLAALVWGLPVAWTALATGVAGVAVALTRGLALQPFLRGKATTLSLRSPRFVGSVVAATALSGILAASGAFAGSRELAVTTIAIPAVALIEAARFSVTKRHANTGALQLAVAWIATLAVFAAPVVSRSVDALVVAWVGANWLVALVHVAAQRRTGGLTLAAADASIAETAPLPWSLALNNVLGQLAAHGVAIAAAGALSVATLDTVQSARLLFRPLALLAAGLPLHLLAHLVQRSERGAPGNPRGEVVSLAVAGPIVAGVYGVVLAIAASQLEVLHTLGTAELLAAAALAGLGLSEAALGVGMIARELERPLLVTRLVALVVGLVAFGAATDPTATGALLFFSVPPLLIVIVAVAVLLRPPPAGIGER